MVPRILSLVLVAGVATVLDADTGDRALDGLRTLDGLRILEELSEDAEYGTVDESTGNVYPYAANGTALGVVVENGNGAADMAGYTGGMDNGNGSGGQDNSTVPTALVSRAALARGCTALDSKTFPAGRGSRASRIARISNRARNIRTNEGPDLPATICITTKPVDIAINGKPVCSKNTQSIQGHFNGTSGYVELSVTTGTEYKVESTTTKTTTFGLSASYSATFGVPEVASVGASTTISSEISNSYGETTSGTSLHQVTSKVSANHKDGQKCRIDVSAV
ncbi:hypothetical protein K523DRAFT_347909 [Schizophyllum commune Tattone D]|nr:hypothetical protein K523DRAFT_347909 [Schizophyllum commune Tattone D]